jgi:hypothetical protein
MNIRITQETLSQKEMFDLVHMLERNIEYLISEGAVSLEGEFNGMTYKAHSSQVETFAYAYNADGIIVSVHQPK